MRLEEVTVRGLLAQDEAGLKIFFEQVLSDTFRRNGIADPGLYEAELADKHDKLTRALQTDSACRLFLVAAYGPGIIGTIEAGPPNPVLKDCSEGTCADLLEIGTVFVHPEVQNKGVATTLWLAMLKKLEAEEVVEICFDSGYPDAQTIWRGLFGPPAFFKGDYWGEGAPHMVWRITVGPAIQRLTARLGTKGPRS